MAKKKNKTKPVNDTSAFLSPRLPVFVVVTVLATWIFIVLKNYWHAYPYDPFLLLSQTLSLNEFPVAEFSKVWAVWKDHLINIVFVCLFWLSTYGWGALLHGKDQFDGENNLFKIVFGLGVTIAFSLIAGFSGLLYPAPFIIFLLGGAGIAVYIIIRNRNSFHAPRFSSGEKLLLISLALPFFIGLIGALSPETFYDSGVYHLGVPQEWINSHRMHMIPSIHMSFYPSNIETLYTIAMLLNNEMTAKLIHFSFGILTMCLMFVMVKKYFSRSAAWLAVVIFWATPYVTFMMGKTNIEMGMAFFEASAFFALINWMDTKQRKWLIISAVCSGLGMGSKYTSVYASFSLVVVLLCFRLFRDKSGLKEALKEAGMFVLISAIMVSPWLIRDFLWVGNPVFPMFWDKLGNIKYKAFSFFTDPPRRPFTLHNIITLPWEMTMGYKNIQEPFSGVLYLVFLPLLFLFKPKNRIIQPFVLYGILYYFLWQYFQAHFRLFVPALPVVCSIYAFWISGQPVKNWRRLLYLLIAVLAVGDILFASMVQKRSENPLGAFLGLVSRADKLSDNNGAYSYVSPNYRAIEWINKNMPEDTYLLFLGETRGLYFKRKFIANTTAEYPPILLYIKASKNEDELADLLGKKGINSIFLNAREVYRLRGYAIYSFNAGEWDIFNRFWDKYVLELYNADWNYVYKILDTESAKMPHPVPRNFVKEIYNPAK
jgi:hypothetical protein